MEAALTATVSFADTLRSRVFAMTLRRPILRRVFLDRATRQQFLFIAATLVYLPLALLFPLWVLVIGPVLYGIPHLFASSRFVHFALAQKPALHDEKTKLRSFHFFAIVWLAVIVARVLFDKGYLGTTLPLSWPELAALVLTTAGLIIIYRKKWSDLALSSLILLPLIFCAWTFPMATSGVLILGHNWVAFFYWFRSTNSAKERAVAGQALLLFALIHVLVLAGAFDWVYHWVQPQAYNRLALLDYSTLGSMITPWSSNHNLWFHAVVLYAFGQAMHYFIWLKAIPDQNHSNPVPASFQTSIQTLISDFGRKSAYAMVALTLISLGIWCILSMPQARELYFWVASYHGYLEIGALSLAIRKA